MKIRVALPTILFLTISQMVLSMFTLKIWRKSVVQETRQTGVEYSLYTIIDSSNIFSVNWCFWKWSPYSKVETKNNCCDGIQSIFKCVEYSLHSIVGIQSIHSMSIVFFEMLALSKSWNKITHDALSVYKLAMVIEAYGVRPKELCLKTVMDQSTEQARGKTTGRPMGILSASRMATLYWQREPNPIQLGHCEMLQLLILLFERIVIDVAAFDAQKSCCIPIASSMILPTTPCWCWCHWII